MCILPNFKATDLEEFNRNTNRGVKKVESRIVEFIVSEKQLENKI